MGKGPIYTQLPLDLQPQQRCSRPEHTPSAGSQAPAEPRRHLKQDYAEPQHVEKDLDRAVDKAGPPAAGQDGSGTVLLVDDEEMVCDLTQRMLERLGYRVLTANDGRQALEVFRAHQDEVVCALVDLTLPGMDGTETLRELRQIRADLPAIVSSGYDQTELDRRLAGDQRCDFVQKPYELAVLRSKLNEVLSKCEDRVKVDSPL
jgi:CheY-like chemotaxis protein